MQRYIGLLEKEDGTLWGLWFPDVPGCVAAASTADETLTQASEALRQWMEIAIEDGERPPVARSLDELTRDPEFRQALTAGSAAVVVPLPAEDRSVHVTVAGIA